MLAPISWLKEYVDIDISPKELEEKLFSAGFEVEEVKELGKEKERAVYVGDSEVDFATAENTGMDCVLVSWGFRTKEEMAAFTPTAWINHPEELLGVLEV